MSEFSLHHLWLVFAREYRVRVWSKSFIFSTLALPLIGGLTGLVMGLAVFLAGPPAVASRDFRGSVVVVCADPAVRKHLATQFAQEPVSEYVIRIDPDDSITHRRSLESQVTTSAVSGYVWLNQSRVPGDRAEYYMPDANDDVYWYLHSNIALGLDRARLSARGIAGTEIDGALRPLEVQFHSLHREPSSNQALARVGESILVPILVFALLIYGALVAGSVVEEKQSRIVELLLVSTKAEELMGGKILGVGCVGLTQMGLWAALGALVTAYFPAARTALTGIHVGVGLPIFFASSFVLGYLLYSTLFAIAGALGGGGNQASGNWMMFPMLPLLLALMFLPYVFAAPGGTVAVVASMFPYFAPVIMSARIAAGAVPDWQIALCFALIVATIAISWIACARIYRVGILMYGKRVSLGEVARWVRYA